MSNNKDKSLMEQVWAYSRNLSIATGIAVSTFTLTGYLWMTIQGDSSKLVEKGGDAMVLSNTDPNRLSSIDTKIQPNTIYSLVSNYELNNSEVNSIAFVESDESSNPESDETNESIGSAIVIAAGDMFENFKTECQNGIVNITWTTDGTDDASFKLEYSADSINFNLLEQAPVLTELSDHKNLFRLTLPANEAETKYFRLRRDFPGNAFMYSASSKIACMRNIEPDAIIDVFPSGNGSYRVVIDSKTDDHFKIVMTDMNEIELVEDEFYAKKGMNQFTFKSGNMPRGNYNLKVTNGINVIQKKVAIK